MKKKIGIFLFYFIFATILCYVVYGVDRYVVMIDAKNQYIPFMNDLFQVLTGKHSFLYTWNLGLGDNFIPIFAYYLASPITMFFSLLAQGDMLNVVNWMVIFRLAMACFTMYLFLTSRYQNRFSWILALGYGFGSYTIGFVDNYMWMDTIILLPLLAIAIDYYRLSKKGYWISIVIALALFSNYYSAAFMVLSASFYYLYQYLIETPLKLKQMLIDLMKYAFYIALGLGLAMFLLYPALSAMEYVKNKSLNLARFFNLFKFNTAALYLPYNLFSGSLSEAYNKSTMIAPLLYCGSATILLNLFYFIKAKWKTKLVLALLFGLMLLPYMFIAFDYMYNLFYSPVWFFYRYSFMLIFFMIFIANLAITQINDHKKTLLLIIGGYALILLTTHGLSLLGKNPLGLLHSEQGQVLLILLFNLVLLALLGWFVAKNQVWLLALIMIFDLGFNAASLIHYCYKEPFHPVKDQYFAKNYPNIPQQEGCLNTFYQTAPFNIGMYSNRQSNSGFSSTMNSNMVDAAILLNAGTTRYNKVLFGGRYALDVLFGNNCVVASDYNDMKYLYNHPEYKLIYEDKTNRVYQSERVYNLGFVATSQIEQIEFKKLPLYYQDLIMIDQVILDQQSILKEDNSYLSKANKMKFPFVFYEDIQKTTKQYQLHSDEAGYYYMKTNLPIRAHMKINDHFVNYSANILELVDLSPYFNARNISDQYLGYVDSSENAIYEFFAYTHELNRYFDTYGHEYGYSIRADDMEEIVSSHLNDITNVTRDQEKVSATVNAIEKGVVILQIPYDEGWQITLNQQKILPIKVNGGLLGFEVPQGVHELKLRYTNKNLTTGIIISLMNLSILGVIIYIQNSKKDHHKKI